MCNLPNHLTKLEEMTLTIPDAYPESAALTPAEFKVWRARYHPDAPRPRQGRATYIVASKAHTMLGTAHSLVVRYYGGRYSIDRA